MSIKRYGTSKHRQPSQAGWAQAAQPAQRVARQASQPSRAAHGQPSQTMLCTSNGSPAEPSSPESGQAGRPTRQACTQAALTDKALHKQGQPSQARHGMAYGIPKHKTLRNLVFSRKYPFTMIIRAPLRGGVYLRLHNS